MGLEKKQTVGKPLKPNKPLRPNSIMKMAALIKGKKQAPNPPAKPSTKTTTDKVAVVKPFEIHSKEATNDGAKDEESPATVHEIAKIPSNYENIEAPDSQEEEYQCSVDDSNEANTYVNGPIKNDRSKLNGLAPDPSLYENIQSKRTEKDDDAGNDDDWDTDDMKNESRKSILLTDTYANISRSRTSIV